MKKTIQALLLLIAVLGFILRPEPANAEMTVAGSSAHLKPQVSEVERSELIQATAVRNVLSRYNSPMKDEADNFILVARTLNLDPYILPSIAGVESGFGRALIPGTFNPFGWNVGRAYFDGWSDGIAKVGYALRHSYFDKGAENLHDVGRIYAGGSTTWAPKVITYMKKFQEEEEKLRRYAFL